MTKKIPLSCFKCERMVIYEYEYLNIPELEEDNIIAAKETCPDCTIDNDYSDFELIYNKKTVN